MDGPTCFYTCVFVCGHGEPPVCICTSEGKYVSKSRECCYVYPGFAGFGYVCGRTCTHV